MLRINPNGVTCCYFKFIRWMLGCRADAELPKSLCIYCQTMFWGSLFIVLFFPVLVLGWISMKLGRMACKLQNPVTDYIVALLERKTTCIKTLDRGPTDFSESPMFAGFEFAVMGFCFAVCIFAVVSVFGMVGLGLWNIADIACSAFYGVTWFLAKLFMGVYLFGSLFHKVYAGTVWLFTNGELWYSVVSWAALIGVWVLAAGVGAIILCSLFIALSKLAVAKRFGRFLTNKLNGYSEAQKIRAERVQQKLSEKPPWKCEYCSYDNNPAKYLHCRECEYAKPEPMPIWVYVFYPIRLIWAFCAWCFSASIMDRKIDIIGPLEVFWSYLVAIIKGMCPLIEFVSPEQLQAEAQASAKARMDREKSKGEEHEKSA